MSPGTSTVVGGGPNDKLVLLADRVYGSATGSPTPSDVSATIQLLGGDQFTNDYQGNPLYILNTAGDPQTGDPSLSSKIYDTSYDFQQQADGTTDLVVGAQTFDTSGGYYKVLWNSEVTIKNYKPGDFGLSFIPDDDSSFSRQEANMQLLIATAQDSSYVNDDASQSWDVWSPSNPAPDYTPPTDAQLAADLAGVLAAPDIPGTGPGPGPAPSAPGTTPVNIAEFVADRWLLDAGQGGFSVADTAVNVAANLDALNGDAALSGISIVGGGPPTITLSASQVLQDGTGLGKITSPFALAVDDTAANIEALTVQQIAALAADKVGTVTATDGGIVLDAAQALGFESDAIRAAASNAGAVTLTDTASAIEALTPDQLYGLATIGVTALSASDGTLALSAAQTAALVAAGASIGTQVGPGPSSPAIAGTRAGQATTAEAPVSPFASVAISDGNAGATDTLTIGLTGTGGTLSGAGLTTNPDGTYTLGGASLSTITSELDALSFTPTAGAAGSPSTTGFTLTDQSSAGTSAADTATAVTDTAAAAPPPPTPSSPTIAGTRAGQATTAEAPVGPFAGVTIADDNVGATDTLTIALTGTGGTLSGAGLAANPDGTYTPGAASPSVLTSELEALAFTPKAGAPGQRSNTAFALADRSSAGITTTDTATTVVDTAASAPVPVNHPTKDETLQAPDGDTTLTAGAGNDTFNGGYGKDTFIYAKADGNLTVNDHANWWDPDRSNTLKLADLNAADVTLSRTAANDLVLTVDGTGRIITVPGTFNSATHDGIQQIAFADGTTWTRDQIAPAAPYRPTANFVPDSSSATDLTHAAGLYIGDYWDSTNDDTILWSSTSGSDTVQLHDYGGAERSTLDLGDLTAAAVTLTRVANDLQVENTSTGAVLTVRDQFAGNNSGVASLAFADATVAASAIVAPYRPTVAD